MIRARAAATLAAVAVLAALGVAALGIHVGESQADALAGISSRPGPPVTALRTLQHAGCPPGRSARSRSSSPPASTPTRSPPGWVTCPASRSTSPLGATYGVLVLVWQHGYGSHAIWGIPATAAITNWVPLMIFAFLSGLSMDYEMFILARIRESYDHPDRDALPNIITNIATTDASVPDAAMTTPIHDSLACRGLLPDEHYVDSGYPSADPLVDSAARYGIALVTPMLADVSRQARARAGLDAAAFHVDFDTQQVTCPEAGPARRGARPANAALRRSWSSSTPIPAGPARCDGTLSPAMEAS